MSLQLINTTLDGLTTTLNQMSQASDAAMKVAAAHTNVNLMCSSEKAQALIASLPNLVHSMDCALNM